MIDPNQLPRTGPVKNDERWPGQVKYILGNEAAERFSYYGMKALLALYITRVLGLSIDTSTIIIATFVMVNYFTPVLGAWVSDRLWGRYHTILWISLSYCLGHGVLACSDLSASVDYKKACLFLGLGLIAFGAGGIKPCVSAFMGDQFPPGQHHRLERAYAAFYWMINLGATCGQLLIPWVKDRHGYALAFSIPGIAMCFATFVFWLGTRHYHRVPPVGDPQWRFKVKWLLSVVSGIAVLVWLSLTESPLFRPALGLMMAGFAAAAAVWTVRMVRRVDDAGAPVDLAAFSVWWYAVLKRLGRKSSGLWASLEGRFTATAIDHGISYGRILSIFAMVPVFWALFDQTQSTWVQQGSAMTPATIPLPFGWGEYAINAETMQAANGFMVLLLVPFMTLLVYPLLKGWMTPLRRMSVGMFIASLSSLIVAGLQKWIEAGEHPSVLWQLVPYLIITMAEVLVSVTGLEFAYRQAAPAMKSTITGYWQLTVAAGNLMIIVITKVLGGESGEGSVSSARFMIYAGLAAFVAIVFSLIAARYRYREVEVA